MSRNGNKKPVGFATHIIAGGIAGGCEAVSPMHRRPLLEADSSDPTVNMPAARYHQGPDAAFEVWSCAWCELTDLKPHTIFKCLTGMCRRKLEGSLQLAL